MAPQATAVPAAAAATTHPAVLDALTLPAAGSVPAQPSGAAMAKVTQRSAAAARPATYTVRPGDSLSSIAGHLYRDPAAWPVLYWRNHRHIRWADDIYAGQVLRVPARPARIPKAPGALRPAAVAHVSPAPAPVQAAAQPRVSTAADAAYAGGTPGGAFGACVVARESGGNAQVMNTTGHYGLYQFSEATWVEYGGNPADFGHATVAEQNQVFANALAAGGESNWAPYDGC